MNSKIKKILEKLEEAGFDAYVVGGYVRDTILGIHTTDVDICTNALPKEIVDIFKTKGNNKTLGSITINDGKYNFDITTYRSESNYDKRIPLNIEYVNDLKLDLLRRDFTINSLCMDKKGNIIDLLNAREDIENKVIKTIGDTYPKLSEDPLRILRALRFSITLDFKLDESIKEFIHNNKKLISTLSYTRKKEELDRIFTSTRNDKGLEILKEYDLLNELDISYEKVVPTNDVLGIWAQITYSDKYIFTKSSADIIKKIREILKIGKIDQNILFKYDLYISRVAGEILGYDSKKIVKMHSLMPVHNVSDINISSLQIFDILNIKPSRLIKEINDDLIENILNNNLLNEYNTLKDYIIKKWM